MKIKETITRKKLYKSGKSWVAAATAFAVMGVSAVTTVSADTQTPVGTTQSQQDLTGQRGQDKPTTKEVIDKKEPVPQVSAQNAGDLSADAKTTKADDKQDTQPTNAQLPDQGNKQTNSNSDKGVKESTTAPVKTTDVPSKSVAPETNTSINASDAISKSQEKQFEKAPDSVPETITGGRYSLKDGYYVYLDKQGKQVVGPKNIDNHLQYFDETTGKQVKGDFRSVNGKRIYFNANLGYADDYTTDVAGKLVGYDSNGNQVKAGYVTNSQGKTYYFNNQGEAIIGLKTDNNKTQYFGPDGAQVKGAFQQVNGKNIYFDAQTGYARQNVGFLDGTAKGFDEQGNQIKSGIATDLSGNVYYFDASGKMLTGVQNIDGKKYYFDEQGHRRRNYAGVFNNEFIYFGLDGVGQSAIEYQFEKGLTSQNSVATSHNAAKSYDTKSFTNVDGFLTANSWYRPTDILRNGTKWEPSTETDFRPLLMTWWPDKEVQANYLNYMSALGLGDQKIYTGASSQLDLNNAALIVQEAIEKKISLEKSTKWLDDSIKSFIKSKHKDIQGNLVDTNPGWTIDSETGSTNHLQNGAFIFTNSPLVPEANAAEGNRLINRTPSQQTGNHISYASQPYSGDDWGYELLLGNDVDNSNPIVQAEQLNWIHYLMNFGTITAPQDPDAHLANFDSIRIDAVDNVDADLLQIAGDYFKAAYQVGENDKNANQHIHILEDWSPNDVWYNQQVNGNSQLTMDATMQNQLLASLTRPITSRDSMKSFTKDALLVHRTADNSYNQAVPNYSFIRAHDSEVQTIIAKIISDKHPDLYPTVDKALLAKDSALYDEAFTEYNADMQKISSQKQYTHNNMPSAYAILLTNKDTVPRVYYGDLFTDNGEYMANKTPYYDAITSLLTARTKFVSGGQSLSVDKNDVLTSVRYGKGALSATDNGSSDTRNQGIGVIVSNNPNLDLNNDKVTLSMGISHAHQAYRPLLLTNSQGIVAYATDSEVPQNLYKTTNDKGELTFDASEIKGYDTVQTSGYLAVWVPVGASDEQDARSIASTEKNNGNSVYHSNAALDSQLIYEGFSNFQTVPSKNASADEYANVIIAKHAADFNKWGVTSFQMAPQYRSSTDGSFLDAVDTVQNGYAFTDRYDLGFNAADGSKNPTKYGTDEDLRNAIKSLHAQKTYDGSSIQVMADFVPDQLYNMPLEQAVSVIRTDKYGVNSENPDIQNIIYAANIKSSGTDYQSIYGGKYLAELQKNPLFKSLFDRIQISTKKTIDPNTRITQWSAKYFNGSNIQGKGINYVLKDWASNKYFNVSSNDDMYSRLPKQLMNQESNTGFIVDDIGVKYYSISGYQAKNTFVEDGNGEWYYFDNDGYMVKSTEESGPLRTVNTSSKKYYILPNGVEIRNSFGQDIQGNTYYFDARGEMVTSQYISDDTQNIYYFNNDGTMAKGLIQLNTNLQYFGTNGAQLKGAYVHDISSDKWYQFDAGSGNGRQLTQRPDDVNANNYISIDSSSNIGVNTDYTAYITSSLREDGLFANAPYGVVTKDQNGNDLKWQYINHTKQYEGQQVQVTRQYTDSKGVSWNLITFAGGDLQGQKLWVDSRALTMTPFKTMNQISFISYANR
ncbi:glycoside hydrolase family 70 protein, partial [Leuconostoc citreum]